MNRRVTHATRAAALIGAPFLILGTTIGPAAAADGDVEVTNTETVQVLMDASAKVKTKRVYEQIALTGTGKVDLENPISNNRLRNLDGFGGFDVKDGKQQVDTNVDGSERFRTVSNYSKKLPLDVSVRYYLDGKQLSPGDVVGKDGDLEVKYNVKNVSGETQTVSYKNGAGETVQKEEKIVVPMVGSLTTVAPSNFTDVKSAQANVAGDGRGATKLSFTMTLFPPIGSDEAEFGYTAKIKNGVVPGASISALPVNPLESPSFKGGAASYKGGADTGAQLTAGATTIDTNLLKLRDGASDLLAGLIQLRNGGKELSAGLNDKAVPGAKKIGAGAGKLADGAGELAGGARKAARGAGELDDGAKKLNKGAGDLDEGAGALKDGLGEAGKKGPQLVDGLRQVRDGLGQVDRGLETMGDQVGAGGQELRAGIAALQAGIGDKGDAEADGTLLGGVNALRGGISTEVLPGLNHIIAGIPESRESLRCGELTLKDLASAAGADDVPSYCPNAAIISGIPVTANAPVLQIVAGKLAEGRANLSNGGPGTGNGTPSQATLEGGLLLIRGGIQTKILPGLVKLGCGLDNQYVAGCTNDAGLAQGLGLVEAGVSKLVGGVVGGIGTSKDTTKDKTLRGGLNGLQDGNGQIIEGGKLLLVGLDKLGAGAGQLQDGTGKLADGTGELSAGTGKLKDGSGQLADGAGKLSAGTGELKTGVFTLVDGLVDAAEGSTKLSDGLGTASKGAPKLVDGADKLSVQGTKKLIEAGDATASDYGQKYAVIEAGAERAQTENMAYGAPENAQGLTAYTFELAANDGESGRNTVRGIAALAVFGAGAGIAMLRRRMLA